MKPSLRECSNFAATAAAMQWGSEDMRQKKFGSVESWENLNWKSIYPELDAEFIVKLTLDDEYIAETRQ